MRLVKRLPVFVLAMTLSASLVACGGGSGDDDGDDDDVSSVVDPAGTDSTYIVDNLVMPTSASQATQLGLNLDGDELGRIDNALGQIMAALAGAAGEGFDINATIEESVTSGTLLLLIRLKATALTTARGVGMWVYLGDNPSPEPCDDPQNPTPETCGNHLDGNGSAEVAADSPTDALVVGDMVASRFTSGPGTLSLELALTDGAPITVELIGARAVATVSADGSGISDGILAGAITDADLQNEVLPAVHAAVNVSVTDDCTGTVPDCCEDGSTGATIVGLFDTNPADCTVSLDEIKNSNLIKSLLTPDVDLLDAGGNYNPLSDGEKDSLSLGVGFSATTGTYTIP